MKQSGKTVVWPANLDSTRSRIEGRRLAKSLAIQVPRLEEINEAAKRLSLETELAPRKSRPSSWWEKEGYLILAKKDTKTNLLRALAGEVKKIRAAEIAQEER